MDVYEIRTNTNQVLYKGGDYTLAVESYYDFKEEAQNDIDSPIFSLDIIGYVNGSPNNLYAKGGRVKVHPLYSVGEGVSTKDGKSYFIENVLRDTKDNFHYRLNSKDTNGIIAPENELQTARESHQSKINIASDNLVKLTVVNEFALIEARAIREDEVYEDDKKAKIYLTEVKDFIKRNNYPKLMSMSTFKYLEQKGLHALNNALSLLGYYGPEMRETYFKAYSDSSNMYLTPNLIKHSYHEKTHHQKIVALEMIKREMEKDKEVSPKDLFKVNMRIDMLKERDEDKYDKGGLLGYKLDVYKIKLNDLSRAIELEQDCKLRDIDVRRSGKTLTVRDYDKLDEVIALLKYNLSFAHPQTKLTFKKGGEISGRYSSVHDFVSRNKLEKEAENIFGKDWEPDDDMQQIRYLAGNNYGVEEIDYETLRDMRSDDYISVYRYDKGGNLMTWGLEPRELADSFTFEELEKLLKDKKISKADYNGAKGYLQSWIDMHPTYLPQRDLTSPKRQKIRDRYEKGGALSKPGVFMVSGYWKDDKSEFNDYLISEYDDVPKGYDDDDIFYYGLSETNLKNSSENDGMEFVITEYRRLENYSQGGALSKEFKFDKNFVVYVPSTSDVSDKISPKELDDRVNEVKQYVANTFGGYTETETEGGYKSSKGDIVEEEVVKVSVFSKNKDWKDKEYEVVQKSKQWAREWGQEAIGFEYEGDLYYIDGDGKMEKGGLTASKKRIKKSWGGTIDMPRGSGWGDYKKGKRVLKIKELKEGGRYLAYSKQFDAKNIVYIIPEGKTDINPSGSSMFTDKKLFIYIKPTKKIEQRNEMEMPMKIGEDQLQDNYANYDFFKIKGYKYSKGGSLTQTKAKQILKDGEANGKDLTEKQKRYFGAIAGGGKSYAEGGEIKEGDIIMINPNKVDKINFGEFIGEELEVTEVSGNTYRTMIAKNRRYLPYLLNKDQIVTPTTYAEGGEVNEVYVDFMNKNKGFRTDRKYFKTYEEAEKWARNEFERFNSDMIGYTEFERPLKDYAKGGGVEWSTPYIGSCVDVGENTGSTICDYFGDATEMAEWVGNPDEGDEGNSKEISKQEFYKHISDSKVKPKHTKGKHTYHYISEDSRGKMTPEESGLFFIYNIDQDIHYFYKHKQSKK